MKDNRHIKYGLVCIMALAGLSAILCLLWREGVFLPRWIGWKDVVVGVSDGTGQFAVSLHHKEVNITSNEKSIWSSPKDVKVQDILCCDIDDDGEEEFILLCWKRGRFGEHRPFFVEEDEKGWSQHIFVYEHRIMLGEEIIIKPQWMSSYLGMDVLEMKAGGGKASGGRLLLTDREGKVNSFVWDSWGFTREDTDISFVVFGDNLIHEQIYTYGLHNVEKDQTFTSDSISDNSLHNFHFLFENMQEVIDESDVAVINQETPFVDDPAYYGGYPRFGTPLGVGEAIDAAGFDVVTCATNHALDRGAYGVNVTKRFLEEKGILCLGVQSEEETAYEPYQIIVRSGISFALLNYSYGTNGIPLPAENPYMVHLLDDEERIRADMAKAKETADFVIVFVHWGTENSAEVDDFQRKWAQVFLESKADVVVGAHPHTLQPYEMLTGEDGHEMLVYYSIGNYISAQSEKSCVKGGMAGFTVSLTRDGCAITEYTLRPLCITWQEGRYGVDFVREP